jgi:hypothetical protein
VHLHQVKVTLVVRETFQHIAPAAVVVVREQLVVTVLELARMAEEQVVTELH